MTFNSSTFSLFALLFAHVALNESEVFLKLLSLKRGNVRPHETVVELVCFIFLMKLFIYDFNFQIKGNHNKMKKYGPKVLCTSPSIRQCIQEVDLAPLILNVVNRWR